MRYLQAHSGVQTMDATGLFGHSEGGWVALRAAVREQPPWLVTNSCPGMTPAAQERYALVGALRRSGAVAPDELDKALSLFDQIMDAGRRDSDLAAAQRLIHSSDVPPAFLEYWADLDERLWEFIKRKYDHDPLPDAAHLRCPHLALFGGADELVPVAESIQAFSTVACRRDRPLAATLSTTTFPGADHRICINSGTSLAPGYLVTLSRWISAQCNREQTPACEHG
jgi:pimeloyl-ACP methyl ester carboxylesterase